MNDSVAGFDGFQIRRPRPEEVGELLAFFPNNSLGNQNIICLGAFGHPGNVPLGAVIVRPAAADNSIGSFLVFVRPEFRRRKIGTMLVHHLYSLALSNNAEKLDVPLLVHQDSPDNSFYLSCGLGPERALATYSVEIQRGLGVCEPAVAHFQQLLGNIRIQPLNTLDLVDVVDFFSAYYAGFADQRLADLRAGVYDLSLSSAALEGNRIVAAVLGRSRPDLSSTMIDIILSAPAYRNGPAPLAVLAYSARLAMQKNHTHCVFEADERYDRFAVGFARRCGAKAQRKRYRYSIGREQMQAQLDKKS